LIGETLDGKYKLVLLLGEGGMGSVYQAEQKGTAERVAVKVINSRLLGPKSDGVHRFRREARAATAVDSKHIVQVLDSGTDKATGLLYLVMEYLQGEDLQHLLDRIGPLAPDAALRIAAQALLGLSKAHEARIVHRDIKPANLFLTRRKDGEVTIKLLDFGIAKIKADPLDLPHTTGLTNTGNFLGSPLYMSPEQVQSSRDVDARTDLWSLGSALYCALTGHPPHKHAESLGQLIITICASPPPPLRKAAPWVPPEVAKVVHGALGLKPSERYPSAAAMLEALLALLPDGFALREEMLVPVPEEQRAAARGPSSHPPHSASSRVVVNLDATQPILGDESTEKRHAATARVGEAAPPLDTIVPTGDLATTPLDTTTRGTEKPRAARGDVGPTPAPSAWPRARAMVPAGAIVAALIGGAWVAGSRSRPAPALMPVPMASASAAVAPAEPPPSPSPRAAPSASAELSAIDAPIRHVKLEVFPKDASVKVNGAPVTVKDGIVEITGPLESEHRVHVFKPGTKEKREVQVRVTEEGASPRKVELSPVAKAKPGPPGLEAGGVKPPPAPVAKPTTAPPPPKPTSSDDELAP
jgi:eukaryotic-like serine/threonine-protein kinase